MHGDTTATDDTNPIVLREKLCAKEVVNKCISFIFSHTEAKDLRTVVGILFWDIESIAVYMFDYIEKALHGTQLS